MINFMNGSLIGNAEDKNILFVLYFFLYNQFLNNLNKIKNK